MFIDRLIIKNNNVVIRDIRFSKGLNLIVDNTSSQDNKTTGNNVGKTTVLKLIDFCLGADAKIIYTDTENSKEVYTLVKDYLTQEEIIVILVLVENLEKPHGKRIEIQRNFLSGKKSIRKINGKSYLVKDFETELEKLILPSKSTEKPSFRQVISHNIRYKDSSINNTLKTLNPFTTDVEYESLYLYLLGCMFNEGAKKQELTSQINQEMMFKIRLEKKQPKTAYEMALAVLNDEIDELNKKKATFNLNESLENDLEQLNYVKYNINKISSYISKLEIRKSMIEESKKELEDSYSQIDLQQLRLLYDEVTLNISGVQKTFEQLVAYHNNMIVEKVKFLTQDLPDLNTKINNAHAEISLLLEEEKTLSQRVSKGDSLSELEKVIFELNDKNRKKGEYETIINQINEVESNIDILTNKINNIDKYLFSEDFEKRLKQQLIKFNKYFSSISEELYNEKYAMSYTKDVNKKNRQFYKFNAFNTNMSSGKKQGEILCFDLAYILFADDEKIDCLHFLLNDKKELMHDNQLLKVAEYLNDKNIQLIISILKDKLPDSLATKCHVAIELSQYDKLFKIDENTTT